MALISLLIFVLALILMGTDSNNASASEVSSTTFRPGSNLSVVTSFQQLEWRVKEAGVVGNAGAWSFAPGLAVRYTFHFQIKKKFGGIIGTDVQGHYDWANVRGNNLPSWCTAGGFRPGPSVSFPSILAGMVQNFVDEKRFILLGGYTATWHPGMKVCADRTYGDHQLSAISHSFSALSGFDFFFSSSAAWSVLGGYRFAYTDCVGAAANCEASRAEKSVLERLSFYSHGPLLQFGITWQPGDEIPLMN